MGTISKADENVLVGAGPYVQSQPYKGLNAYVIPTPVIFFDNQLVYVRWAQVGVYFAGSATDEFSWGLSLAARPNPWGYDPANSSYLSGMSRRTWSVDGGVELITQYQDYYMLLNFWYDLLNVSSGYTIEGRFGTSFSLGKFKFFPMLLLQWASMNTNNYYFGVRSDEARAGRPAYSATAGLNYGAQTYIQYPILEDWVVMMNLRADVLNPSAQNSPIVDAQAQYSGMLSLLYSFKYSDAKKYLDDIF